MKPNVQQDNADIKQQNSRQVVRALLISWSIFYFLYALLGVWLGTGKDALAGPHTSSTDYIFAGVWFGLSVLQMAAAVVLNKRPQRWLLRTTITFAVLSIITVIAPPLLSPLFTK
jgi:hypothetical protein